MLLVGMVLVDHIMAVVEDSRNVRKFACQVSTDLLDGTSGEIIHWLD